MYIYNHVLLYNYATLEDIMNVHVCIIPVLYK